MLISEPLSRHTSFKIGGPADVLIIPENVSQLRLLVLYATKNGIPLCILGKGTNLLVLDEGVPGIIVKIAGGFDYIRISGTEIKCGAGAPLSLVLKKAAYHSLAGLEFAAGIPGSVGGAIFMNAGSKMGNIGAIVDQVVAIDFNGDYHFFSNKQCRFGYRTSVFNSKKLIILWAVLRLSKGEKEDIVKKVKQELAKRAEKQPLSRPNAGCVFKNPPGFSAGELIDKAGLKGRIINGAQISDVHSNFIINLGNASATDVLNLMALAKKEVGALGVSLNPEIRVIPEKRD